LKKTGKMPYNEKSDTIMMNEYRKRIFVTLACLLTAGAVFGADDFSIQAHVDQTVIGLNQQFTLSVELSGKGANSVSNPELPAMDFAAFMGSGSSQNIQFINGKMSVSKTISYHFTATAAGQFEIEAVKVIHDNKTYETDPIAIQIVSNSQQGTARSGQQAKPVQGSGPAEGDLFLRATVNKKRAYQNEPVVVTFDLYTRVDVASFGLSKLPATTGFWVEEFPLPQTPQTRSEILEGKQYTVATLKKMALFPMSEGVKTIAPMSVECDVRVRKKRSRSMFDDFFNDSFFYGQTQRKALSSKAVQIQVLPLPETGKPDDFSGAVGQFKMSGKADKTDAKTNEAISYKIVISGEGNIRTLPEPDVVFSPDFEVYPPKKTEKINRDGNRISGVQTYEYVLVPRVAGLQKIKPVRLSVFNPKTGAYEILKTREVNIRVTKGSEMFTAAPSGLSKEEVRLIGQDIRFIKTETPVFRKIGRIFYRQPLFWIILIAPLLSIASAFGYRRHLNRLYGDVAYARGRRATKQVKKRFTGAREYLKSDTQKSFYSEIHKGLMSYLGDKLNIAESGMISEEVRKLLAVRGVPESSVEGYFGCMQTCDMMRFSPSGSDEEEMKKFLKKAENAVSDMDKYL